MRLGQIGGADILPAVHHADDIDARGLRNVKYDVVVNRKAAHVLSQVRSSTSGLRIFHKHFEYGTKPIKQFFGSFAIVGGDIG